MTISAIIATFNGLELLQKSLPKLLKAVHDIDYEIIVVDNGSTDNTCQYLNNLNCHQIHYLQLAKNYGFAGASDRGAEIARGKYLFFINNDCYLQTNTIQKMINYLEKNKKIAAVSPKIIGRYHQIQNLGYLVDLKKARAKVLTDEKDPILANPQQFNQNIFQTGYFFGLPATCLLIRRNIYQKIGGFDRRFHSYLEDVDLCLRLAKNNYPVHTLLDSVCIHDHLATARKMGRYKPRHDFQNWIRIILKNYPIKFIRQNFLSLLIERIRNLNGILKNHYC